MAFNDLLSSSFLFSIAIIIILIGGIFAYVSYRMSEQDHKISSMLGLISTMAGELQFFRSKLSKKQEEEYEQGQEVEQQHEQIILDPNNLIGGSIEHPVLISVSDDENEDDEDEDDENEDEDEDEDDEDEDDDDVDDDESEIEELDIDEEPFDFIRNEQDNLEEIIELEHTILNFENITEDTTENNNIKSIHLEEPIDLNFTNKDQEEEQEDKLVISDLKTISIADLEEPNKKQEYKKMSINKLREVVVEKGITTDASKLKKPDLLKLLGDE